MQALAASKTFVGSGLVTHTHTHTHLGSMPSFRSRGRSAQYWTADSVGAALAACAVSPCIVDRLPVAVAAVVPFLFAHAVEKMPSPRGARVRLVDVLVIGAANAALFS